MQQRIQKALQSEPSIITEPHTNMWRTNDKFDVFFTKMGE